MLNRTASFAASIITNLILVGLFVRALMDPVEFKDFIYKTGLMIFVLEFMTLHSSGMFFGSQQKTDGKSPLKTVKAKIAMISFYSLFIVTFAAMTKQWLAAVYFVVSLVSKAFFSRAINPEQRMAPVAAGIVMLLLSTFIVVWSAGLLVDWFPFPSEVRSAKPAGQSGLFIDKPQTMVVWGILYFSLMTVCEVLIFRAGLKKKPSFTRPSVRAASTQ